MSNTLYSKNDISEILRKASEIQTQKDLYGDKEGLSEEELIQLASEVGIDKESLLEAIEYKSIDSFNDTFNWSEGTTSLQSIELIEGEVTDENWDEVVREIRKIIGGIGKDSKKRTSFEWEQRLSDVGYRHISFTPQNGKTKIQYAYRWRGIKLLSGFLFGAIAFILTTAYLKEMEVAKSITILGGFLAGGIGSFLNRIVLKPYFDRQKALTNELVQSLRKILKSPQQPLISIEDAEVYTSEERRSTTNQAQKTD